MLTLKVDKREVFGRKVKKLRKDGLLPANIFGKKVKSQAIEVEMGAFEKVYKEAGETQVIELLLGKEKKPVLIHHIQEDPVTDYAVHIDFLQVDLKEKVTAQVPIELLGESPAEKEGKGVVVQQIDEIEVEALPGDLPEKFEIDLSSLVNEDDAIYVKDIKIDTKKIGIKNEPDQIVVKVEQAKKEEEVPVAPAVPGGEEPPSAEGESVTGDKDKELGEKEKEVKDEKKQTP